MICTGSISGVSVWWHKYVMVCASGVVLVSIVCCKLAVQCLLVLTWWRSASLKHTDVRIVIKFHMLILIPDSRKKQQILLPNPLNTVRALWNVAYYILPLFGHPIPPYTIVNGIEQYCCVSERTRTAGTWCHFPPGQCSTLAASAGTLSLSPHDHCMHALAKGPLQGSCDWFLHHQSKKCFLCKPLKWLSYLECLALNCNKIKHCNYP